MKKKLLVILLIIVGFCLGIFLGFLIKGQFFKEECVCEDCHREPIIKEYLSYKDQKIYLYNLNELEINDENTIVTLKDYIAKFKDFNQAFKSIESDLELQKTLRDGGTKIYGIKKDSKLITKSDLTVISCNTTDGNTDVYFGTYLDTVEAFDNGVCGKNFFTDTSFTRVYTIDKIKVLDTKVENDIKKYYLEITISDDEGKSVKIERIMTEDNKNILKEKEKFTFYFENKYKEHIKEDIEYIFENCTLTGVVPYGK